ncbi:MAG: winged helix DNA-binding domain-containing protein [Candidatus Obscuribacterales bacterium]|nr:winged helix DNA-binding domain-containing protein [Candidatus Obscuribacterales bacterium]
MTFANVRQLRTYAVNNSLFRPRTLKAAIKHLGFVQADPIRSPARAQDLILRHRVKDYRAGDLERQYSKLDVEEDLLYAYGFLSRENWRLLHPRQNARLSKSEKLVLHLASEQGEIHPRDLRPHLGDERALNAWGGYSKVSTRILEDLHYRGLLRIVRREDGIKLYGPVEKVEQALDPTVRLKKLVLLIASILSPLPESSLRSAVNHLAHAAPTLPGRLTIVKQLIQEGALEQGKIDGVNYVWTEALKTLDEAPPVVRIVAPFDPLVWDRKRFEHLWNWVYRFEAYTPPPKRRLGYYAMPLLWKDDVIGWANVSAKSGIFDIETGYVIGKPKERAFRVSLDDEVSRMKFFLGYS